MMKYSFSLITSLVVVLLLPLLIAAAEPRKTLITADLEKASASLNSFENKYIALATDFDLKDDYFRPIENINDPHIQNLGKLALDEHNEQVKGNLQFLKVGSGYYQVVEQGTNYQLWARAFNGTYYNYIAEVYEQKLRLDRFTFKI